MIKTPKINVIYYAHQKIYTEQALVEKNLFLCYITFKSEATWIYR